MLVVKEFQANSYLQLIFTSDTYRQMILAHSGEPLKFSSKRTFRRI
jgi:hypothetical protein